MHKLSRQEDRLYG